MKKLLTLALALVLALSPIGALAAEYSDKATVKKVQQALNDAGYNCGTPDGSAGKKTKAAISDYRAANGLDATGAIDDELLMALGLAEAAEATEGAPAEATEEAAGEGFTFQGIPWGSTPEEAMGYLVDSGYFDAETLKTIGYNNDFSCYYNEDDLEGLLYLNGTRGIGGNYQIWNSGMLKMLEICGYTPEYFHLYFLNGIENGQIVDEQHLTMVGIHFQLNGKSEFDDMTNKISESCGKCDKQGDKYSYFLNRWTGSDNTVIALFYMGSFTTLIYAKSDDYLTVQEIQALNK